jgi:hypothetical protein
MQATELRINNLVGFGNNIVPIKSIHTESVLKNEVNVYVELNEKLQNYCLSIFEIKPIPLTDKLLLDCGFEWKGIVGKNRFLTKYTPCGKAIVFKDGYIIFAGVTIECPVGYLHQLQNIYFALTNQELTLMLP